MGENGKGNGGYVNLPFLRKMRIFGFACDMKFSDLPFFPGQDPEKSRISENFS